MGEAKRRKTALGEKYGQEAQIFLPDPQNQAQQFVSGAIAVLGLVSAFWLFLGNSSVPWPLSAGGKSTRTRRKAAHEEEWGKNSFSHCPLLFFP